MSYMQFELSALNKEDVSEFKRDMQEAFQAGAESYFGESYGEVLPEGDIDESLSNPTAAAYRATMDGAPVGGAIVSFDNDGKAGHLDFLFVKTGVQSKGIGQRIWHQIESMYPNVELWETYTPYFDKRNIHFYINSLGFAAVEFFNKKHPDPHDPQARATSDAQGRSHDDSQAQACSPNASRDRSNDDQRDHSNDDGAEMFRFEKKMHS